MGWGGGGGGVVRVVLFKSQHTLGNAFVSRFDLAVRR